jgi:hypothetical protein
MSGFIPFIAMLLLTYVIGLGIGYLLFGMNNDTDGSTGS